MSAVMAVSTARRILREPGAFSPGEAAVAHEVVSTFEALTACVSDRTVVDGSTEPCARCGQMPLVAGPVVHGTVYCAACTAENRRQEIARRERVKAADRRRRLGLDGAR